MSRFMLASFSVLLNYDQSDQKLVLHAYSNLLWPLETQYASSLYGVYAPSNLIYFLFKQHHIYNIVHGLKQVHVYAVKRNHCL